MTCEGVTGVTNSTSAVKEKKGRKMADGPPSSLPLALTTSPAQELQNSVRALMCDQVHVPPSLKNLATKGMCHALTELMTANADTFLELLPRVEEVLQTYQLPEGVSQCIREAVKTAWNTAPGEVIDDIVDKLWNDAEGVTRATRMMTADIVLSLRESFLDRASRFCHDPVVKRARNKMRLWRPLIERPVVLVLLESPYDRSSAESLGADQGARAYIIMNTSLLREMMRDKGILHRNRVRRVASAFRGPDWLKFTMIEQARSYPPCNTTHATTDSDDNAEDEQDQGRDDKETTWEILNPITSENVIRDISDPCQWLPVDKDSVEFEPTGEIKRDRVFYYISPASRVRAAYSFDPDDDTPVICHFDDNESSSDSSSDEDENNNVSVEYANKRRRLNHRSRLNRNKPVAKQQSVAIFG